MSKDIKDYLHLYLGCECLIEDAVKVVLCGFEQYANNDYRPVIRAVNYSAFRPKMVNEWHLIKPILRQLSDMSEEEKIMLCCLNMPKGCNPGHTYISNEEDIAAMRIYNNEGDCKSLYIPKNRISPNNFIWLLSKHFDLFGLIEQGLAIDYKTIQKQTNEKANSTNPNNSIFLH